MKTYRRFVALFLVVTMLCSMIVCVSATDLEISHVTNGVSGTSTITTYSPSTVPTRTPTSAYIDFDDADSVEYTYNLTYYENEDAFVGVNIDFTISSSSGEYEFSAAGDVERLVLNNSLTLIKGPLWGNITVDNIAYNYSVGFTKLEQSDDISIGLVITSEDNSYQHLYSFGTPIMTEDVQAALDAYTSQLPASSTNDLTSPVPTAEANSNYTFAASDVGNIVPTFPSDATGSGCNLMVFKDNVNKRYMLTLESKCQNFTASDFPSGQLIGVYVDSFEIGIKKTSDSCYLAGMSQIDLPGSGEKSSLSKVFSSAKSLLELLPSPYNTLATTILDILDAVTPKAKIVYPETNFIDHLWVSVSTGLGSRLNFDDAAIPVVFQVANSSTTVKSFSGKAYGSIIYLADLVGAAFYIPTETAECSVTMSGVG